MSATRKKKSPHKKKALYKTKVLSFGWSGGGGSSEVTIEKTGDSLALVTFKVHHVHDDYADIKFEFSLNQDETKNLVDKLTKMLGEI